MSGNTDRLKNVKLRMLVHAAIVLPQNTSWRPTALGQGTVVGIIEKSSSNYKWMLKQNPIRVRGEIMVWWLNSDGNECLGFLAKNTVMKAVTGRVDLRYRSFSHDDDKITNYDRCREEAMLAGMSLKKWFNRIGRSTPILLRAVVRELGGATTKTDGGSTLVFRLGRMITYAEGRTMARDKGRKVKEAESVEEEEDEVEETDETEASDEGDEDEGDDEGEEVEEEEEEQPARKRAGKKGGKKTAAKKSGKKAAAEEPARSAARSLGEALLPLVKGKGDLVKTAKKLAADEKVGKKEMIALRDGINEFATELRDGGKNKQASELSAVNRVVRRIARSL